MTTSLQNKLVLIACLLPQIRRLTTEAVEQVNMRTAWQDDDDDDDDMMASFDVYNQSERMAIKRRLGRHQGTRRNKNKLRGIGYDLALGAASQNSENRFRNI